MRAAVVGLLLVASCSSKDHGGGAATPAAPDAAPPRACSPADAMACLAERQPACSAAGGQAWRLSTGNLGVVTVSAAGLVRLDFAGKQMFGIDSRDWLACMPTCPGGAAAPVCVPYHFSLAISGEVEKTCTDEPARDTEWQGQPARALKWSCPSATIEMLLVPGLRPVRDALIEVHAIDAKSLLTTLDGLVVQMKIGNEVVLDMGEVKAVPCAELAPPAGHRRVDRPEDFVAMRALAPELEQNFKSATAEAGKRLSAEILAEGQAAAVQILGKQCLGPRPSYDTAEVQACLAKHPEIPIQQVVGNAVMQVASRRAPDQARLMTDAIRTHVDEPLCKRFAPAR